VLASQLLGHVGEVTEAQLRTRRYGSGDTVGQAGIEASYDRFLRGRAGPRTHSRTGSRSHERTTRGRRTPVPPSRSIRRRARSARSPRTRRSTRGCTSASTTHSGCARSSTRRRRRKRISPRSTAQSRGCIRRVPRSSS
jgi:hypothetical protein